MKNLFINPPNNPIYFLSFFKKNENGSGGTVPIFACGNVPLDNLTYPLGMLLYHVPGDALASMPKKLPIFSNRYRRAMVSVSAPFDAAMVQRAETRMEKMVQEHVISPTLSAPIREIFRQDYCAREVLDLPDYSRQSVVLNNRIWKRLFSDATAAPEMIYLELEKIVFLLLKTDLNNPESLTWRVMFEPALREALLKELDGAKACWEMDKLAKRLSMDRFDASEKNATNGCGTLFFWGINEAGRRIPLYLETSGQNNMMLRGVDDRGNTYELAFRPDTILDALGRHRLLPSLFTCFLVLSFARGVACAGGYYQGEYLPAMQAGLIEALDNTPGCRDVAAHVQNVTTYTYLSGMQTVMTRIGIDALIPAGPLEIIADGGLTEQDIEKILLLTVKDAHIASLFETVADVAPQALETPGWKQDLAQESFRLLNDKVVIK